MNSLLPLIAPPLLGAFIGYMTNYVAIRMLFRPLRPWRFLGFRIPLTPGVIPSKRHDLAENIGEMVGGHLLTNTDVSRALTEAGFQNELLGLIEDRVENILGKDLGPVVSLVPKGFRSYFEVSIKVLRLRFLEHLHSHIDGDQFTENISATISAQVNSFLDSPLEEMLPEERLEHLYSFLENSTANFLGGPEVQKWISIQINQAIDDFIQKDGCINDLMPVDIKNALLEKLGGETPGLLAKVAELLKDPGVQKNIASGIGKGISNFASSMGPMISLISNFIKPEKIEEKVASYLAEHSDTLSQWLYDPAVRERVTAVVKEKTEQILSTPVSTWLENLPPEKVQNARQLIVDKFVATLNNPQLARSLTNLVKDALATQYKRPLKDILTDLFGAEGASRGISWTTNEMITVIRSPKVKKMLDDLVTEMVEQRLLKQRVGKLSAFLPKEVQEGIADYLLQQVSDILVREVPGLVDSLNIKNIVAQKVDSLDLLRLEGLLLGIMQEQFKYINLFGGLLGFLIGLVNLLFLIGR